MRSITSLFVILSLGALMLTGCQSGATAETTESTGGAGTTGGSAPVASGPAHVGTYHPVMTEEMKKQADDAKAQAMTQVEALKKTNPAQAAELEKMMQENDPEAMLKKMSLEVKEDKTFSLTMPAGDATSVMAGTYTMEGDKITMTATTKDDKPAEGEDTKPVTGTFSEADGTITLSEAGTTMVFKKG
ncbi:MAG: hypothetical protein KF812_04115 [Fimbriimonadaceae bacterium]|nr:hypothetical protein [Fimbriimonadaceae bacterium]